MTRGAPPGLVAPGRARAAVAAPGRATPPGDAAPDVELEEVPCDLCGARDVVVMYRKPDTRYWVSPHEFAAVRCRRCGLGFVSPRPTARALAAFYPEGFFVRRGVEDGRERYERQARYLEAVPPGRLLDLGCAGGAFLRVVQARGWEVHGMDLFAPPVPPDLPVRYGELPELGYPACSFDVVTAWAVLEHVRRPGAYFAEVARLLRPGGRLVCLVTNLRSVWSRFAYGEDIPRHLYFYSPRTLAGYAAAAGLRLARLEHGPPVFPADSTDVFRVRLLRGLGVGWRDVYGPPARLPAPLRLAARAARGLGVAAMRRGLEARLGIAGVVLAVLEKPRAAAA